MVGDLVPALFAGIIGLCVGSFLNVVVYRLPRIMRRGWAADAATILAEAEVLSEIGLPSEPALEPTLGPALTRITGALAALTPLSLAKPGSRCPACGHQIRAWENIPLVSWLAQRGRCTACGTGISVRYPLIEALVGVLFFFAAWQFGPTLTLLAALLFIAVCIALTFIDAQTQLLPDALTLSLLWLGILVNLSGHGFASLEQSVVGAVAGYLVFWSIGTLFRLVRGIEGMGAGDYKLLAALGAWFGWQALLPIVLLSAGVGSLVGITLMLMRRARLLTALPFGVYLAPAGILMLFFGPAVIAWILPRGA